MKKLISTFLVIIVAISTLVLLSACDSDTSNLIGAKSNGQKDTCEKIAQNLSVNEIDTAVSLSGTLETPLSEEEKSIVMEALEMRINNRLKTFLTSFASQSCLVSQETLDEVNQYKTILTNVGITDTDYTNIDDYVDSVLALETYKKYDDIWVFWEVAIDDWNDGNTYWERAVSSYSDYMINSHLQKSLSSFENCVNHANNYSQNSFGIKEVKSMAQAYVDKIEYYFSTGYDMTVSEYTINSFQKSQDEFSSKSNELLSKMKKLPLSVYYGE